MGFPYLQWAVNWSYHSLGIVYAVMLLRFHGCSLPGIARRHNLTAQRTSALTVFPPLRLQYFLRLGGRVELYIYQLGMGTLPCSHLFFALLFSKSVSEGNFLRSLTFVSLSSFSPSQSHFHHFKANPLACFPFGTFRATEFTSLSEFLSAQALLLSISTHAGFYYPIPWKKSTSSN